MNTNSNEVRPGRLAGRRIVVTGAASGIGLAIAELFKKEGARLALLDRQADAVSEQARLLDACACVVDVADAEGVKAAIERAAGNLGGLDGVVNAAGIGVIASFAETDESLWQQSLEVNLSGPYRICRAALPHLQRSGIATIVNISSGAAIQPLLRRSAYAAAKAGLIAFGKVLAMELAPSIRVNTLVPGAIDTPMVSNAFQGASLDAVTQRYALKRLGLPNEVAAGALFLTCEESSFVTGSTLVVDGGRIFH